MGNNRQSSNEKMISDQPVNLAFGKPSSQRNAVTRNTKMNQINSDVETNITDISTNEISVDGRPQKTSKSPFKRLESEMDNFSSSHERQNHEEQAKENAYNQNDPTFYPHEDRRFKTETIDAPQLDNNFSGQTIGAKRDFNTSENKIHSSNYDPIRDPFQDNTTEKPRLNNVGHSQKLKEKR